MTIRIILFATCLLLASNNELIGQDRLTQKKIARYINSATNRYQNNNYKSAARISKRILDIDSLNSKAYIIKGYSHFELKQYDEASNALNNVSAETKEKNRIDYYYKTAVANHLSYNFDNAISNYTEARKTNLKYSNKFDIYLGQAFSGKNVIVDSTCEITLLKRVNTKSNEIRPVLLETDNHLYFTSDKYEFTSFNDELLHFKHILKYKGKGRPVDLSLLRNTRNNDVILSFHRDKNNNIMFFERNGDIFQSKYGTDKWLRAKSFKAFNSRFKEKDFCLTSDGNTAYFVRDIGRNRKGEIYYSTLDSNSVWSKPINLEVLNSDFDESSVWINSGGDTLYFSSNGFNSIGGYDIFKSVKDSAGMWSTPINLGIPINTPYNEIDYKHYDSIAYFSSARNSDNYNIYKATYYKKKTILNNEDVSIEDISIPIPDKIIKSRIDTFSIVSNILFESDDNKLVKYETLDALAKYLIKNPESIIEITGHTDNKGTKKHNDILSAQRANSVRNYLLQKGVLAKQILSYGKRDRYPIAHNNESGCKYNRRVDFKVIKQGNPILIIEPLNIPSELLIPSDQDICYSIFLEANNTSDPQYLYPEQIDVSYKKFDDVYVYYTNKFRSFYEAKQYLKQIEKTLKRVNIPNSNCFIFINNDN
ncbi:MAG: OmpA family protein [bacterium]|nr:OmpA family protein [bacterium]